MDLFIYTFYLWILKLSSLYAVALLIKIIQLHILTRPLKCQNKWVSFLKCCIQFQHQDKPNKEFSFPVSYQYLQYSEHMEIYDFCCLDTHEDIH